MKKSDRKPPQRRPQGFKAKAAQQQMRERYFVAAMEIFYALAVGLMILRGHWRLPSAAMAPRVGDILYVAPADARNDDTRAAGMLTVQMPPSRVPARQVAPPWGQPGRACMLNLADMGKGTLSVLAVRPDGAILAWAGGRTAAGAAACHGAVLVAPDDFNELIRSLEPVHAALAR